MSAQPPGSRGVICFLHAFPLNAGMWAEQVAAVRDAGWTAIAPNFPGFGGQPVGDTHSLDDFARVLTPQLRGLPEAPVVVGLSMGGYVAFRLLEQGLSVRGLVLADTKATPDTPPAAEKRLAAANRAEREGVAWALAEVIPGLLSPGVTPPTLRRAQALASEVTPEGFANAQRAMAARPDSQAMLRGVTAPALILVGEHDKVTGLAEAEAMTAILPPTAELGVIQDAGHLSNLENPVAFNARLLKFLDALGA